MFGVYARNGSAVAGTEGEAREREDTASLKAGRFSSRQGREKASWAHEVLWAFGWDFIFVVEVMFLLASLANFFFFPPPPPLTQHGGRCSGWRPLEAPAGDQRPSTGLRPGAAPAGIAVRGARFPVRKPFRLASLERGGEPRLARELPQAGVRATRFNWHPACGLLRQGSAGELGRVGGRSSRPESAARGERRPTRGSSGEARRRRERKTGKARLPAGPWLGACPSCSRGTSGSRRFQGGCTTVSRTCSAEGGARADRSPRRCEVPELGGQRVGRQPRGQRRLPSKRPLAASRIETRRPGRAGAPPASGASRSPPSTGPGGVPLEDFRGHRLLLVFSAPETAHPCVELSLSWQGFARRYRRPCTRIGGGKAVTRRSTRNRQKARAEGIDFFRWCWQPGERFLSKGLRGPSPHPSAF